ncbi:hypothetical protein [Cryobacterium aureum]|uniref:hypothetical protein n=1 Tax=Cryobacterium aureum TaxID=995037 RepID=UPI000CF4FEAF|nr:hypothetical protein [Cryobacterium aureum]
MGVTLSVGERETVRGIEGDILAAGDNLRHAALADQVTALLDLGVFNDIRGIEELATRVGSSSQHAPDALALIAADGSLTNEQRAFAALAAAIGYRRAGAPDQSNAVLDKLANLRVDWPHTDALVLHLQSINFLGANVAGLERGIALSRRANALMPHSAGLMHGLAHLLLEYGIWNDGASSTRDATWREALDLVSGALAERDWPKFHFTKGRLLLRLGVSERDISEALDELRLAADRESRSAFDSNERRLQHTIERSLAEIRRVVRAGEVELERRLDSTIDEFAEKSATMSRELGEKVAIESRAAQNQSITVIGFVTVGLAMLPLATGMFGFIETSGLWQVMLGMLGFAGILWGAVWFATYNLNRGMQKVIRSMQSLDTDRSARR